MGRKSLLTPERQERIVNAIKAGNYSFVAAQLGGIGERTFYSWMERGEKGEEPYAQFMQAVKEAETHAEARNIALVQRHAQSSWQAAAWYLERKAPDRWGRRERIEHTGASGGPITLAGMAELLRQGEGEDHDGEAG
jgi:transposase